MLLPRLRQQKQPRLESLDNLVETAVCSQYGTERPFQRKGKSYVLFSRESIRRTIHANAHRRGVGRIGRAASNGRHHDRFMDMFHYHLL